jgi:endonuclease/exonuclease/phosphatase (EEP) superfamily protein YafD
MITKASKYPYYQIPISILLSIVAALVIFTPNVIVFKWGANYAFQIMLSYLILGFVFLLLDFTKLMFTSFACCAGLCIFINNQSEGPFLSSSENQVIKVAHFDLSFSNEGPDETMEIIESTSADLVSVHEVTPVWEAALKDCLIDEFPYQYALPGISLYGMAVLSKYPLDFIDTFANNGIPAIIGCVSMDGGDFCFINIHSHPVLTDADYNWQKVYLNEVNTRIQKLPPPVLAIGDFQAVAWSEAMKDFRSQTGLKDSRRGPNPTFPDGDLNIFEIPTDHILYTKEFSCSEFKTVSGPNSRHLGIFGSFHFNEPENELSQIYR